MSLCPWSRVLAPMSVAVLVALGVARADECKPPKAVAPCTAVEPQIAIEARIVSLSDCAFAECARECGLDQRPTACVDAATAAEIMKQLAGDTRSMVLSTPRITTLNHQRAVVTCCQEQHCATSLANGRHFVPQDVVAQVEPMTTGVTMAIRPSVVPGTTSVMLSLDVDVVEATEATADLVPVTRMCRIVCGEVTQDAPVPFTLLLQQPAATKRGMKKVAVVPQGQAILLDLGRANRTVREVNKVPLLSELPLIGEMFQCESSRLESDHLVVMVSPKVLTCGGEEATACPSAATACKSDGPCCAATKAIACCPLTAACPSQAACATKADAPCCAAAAPKTATCPSAAPCCATAAAQPAPCATATCPPTMPSCTAVKAETCPAPCHALTATVKAPEALPMPAPRAPQAVMHFQVRMANATPPMSVFAPTPTVPPMQFVPSMPMVAPLHFTPSMVAMPPAPMHFAYGVPLSPPMGVEESSAPTPKAPANAKLAKLMEKYRAACAAGRTDAARKFAAKCIEIDPTCFGSN